MKRYVILVAGGSGNRMKSEIPKQFLSFKGKPVLIHTIERFLDFDKDINILLILPESGKHYWNEYLKIFPHLSQVKVVSGGSTRSDSAKAGLDLVPEDCIVAIHDAVRPLLSQRLIERCFATAERSGNACPVVNASDSLRIKDDTQNRSVDRSVYFQVQTPQCFRAKLIKDAFRNRKDNSYTDEISLLEKAGHEIHLVEGDRWNIKITYPEDLLVAETLSSLL
jgi:2-C-methyl-D-erythritol 4-phosphate cytidylyltransferase